MRLLLHAAIMLIATLRCAVAPAQELLPRSVLVLDQSIPYTEYFGKLIGALQSTLKAGSSAPITLYSERLEYSHFKGPEYERLLHTFIKEKYREKPIGIIIAVGFDALQFAVALRSELDTRPPIVFSSIDDRVAAQLKLPPDVTGTTLRATVQDAVIAAKALVPRLRQIAVIGDPLPQQTYRRHYQQELQDLAGGPTYSDLTGLTMREVLNRVASLSADTAIFYTTFSYDRDGMRYDPNDALALVAQTANRPIVIDQETRLGHGGAGGFLLQAAPIGEETGRRVLRILNGERASQIPIEAGKFFKPVFDWRELRRWNVSEGSLPSGSEIRFREVSAWEQYRWQIALTGVALAMQSLLIAGLFYQRQRRRSAEVEARRRMGELALVNRRAAIGEMSASIAHEISQPLTAIATNSNAGLRWLARESPNVERAATIFKRIGRDADRAAQVIASIRTMFKKDEDQSRSLVDVNDVIREVLALLHIELEEHEVAARTALSDGPQRVLADRIQLQQVILNLARNAIEAMGAVTGRQRVLKLESAATESEFIITITDSGPGIEPDVLTRIFDPFFTTKSNGMGMGLSICRSIVEAHGGRLSAASAKPCGAVFEIVLPLP